MLFSLTSLYSVFAQTPENEILYLKNGSEIHGVILEIIPNQTVKIQTKDKSIFVFKMDEVDKIIKEPKPQAETYQYQVYQPSQDDLVKQEPTYPFKNKGYTNFTKIGILGLSSFNVQEINGYLFNPHLFLGLGLSYDYYRGDALNFLANGIFDDGSSSSNDQVSTFLPVFVDFRYFAGEGRSSFMSFVDLGYSALLDATDATNTNQSSSDYKVDGGGLYFCPGIGMRVYASKNFGLVFDFGLKFQNYSAKEYTYSYNGNGISTYSLSGSSTNKISVLPVLNIGITF